MDKGLRDTAVRSFFFSGQAPEARPARCPMLTYNGGSCKCTSPAMAGYRPIKVYMVLSLGCNGEGEATTAKTRLQRQWRCCGGEGEAATAKARLRRRRRGCDGEGEAATAKARLQRRGRHAYCIPYILRHPHALQSI
jgi:hypothetical protein